MFSNCWGKKTDAENEINSACAKMARKQDVETKFGTDFKMHSPIQKDHKDFKLSEACKTARKLETLRA